MSAGTCFQSNKVCRKEDMFILKDECSGVDGIGFAEEDYFKDILKQTFRQPFFHSKAIPWFTDKTIQQISAVQIRVLGVKGVITCVPKSYWKEIQQRYKFGDAKLVIRESMVKFEGNPKIYGYFDIYNYSSVQGGNMNRNVFQCLLKMTTDSGKMEKIFTGLLSNYIQEFMDKDEDMKFIDTLYSPNLESSQSSSLDNIVRSLILAGHSIGLPFIHKNITTKFKQRFQTILDDKLSLKFQTPYTCNLIGIIDESGTLQPDEVYIPCLKLMTDLGIPGYQDLNSILFYRNPLAYEGDIQKMKLVKTTTNPFLKSLSNVIVFPKVLNGKSPHQMAAGGDLDGDLYEIIYHPGIIELFAKNIEQIDYDEVKNNPPPRQNIPSVQDVIDAHIQAFSSRKSYTGLLYYYATIYRDSEEFNVKQRISKAYARSIDLIKSDLNNNFQSIVDEMTRPAPQWYKNIKENVYIVGSEKISKLSNDIFEYKMVKVVNNLYQNFMEKRNNAKNGLQRLSIAMYSTRKVQRGRN